MPNDIPYILGHSEAELHRLRLQAAIIQPITRRLLVEAGLRPGMRVLDIGCGTGEVSLLAAELAGPTGMVIGIDRAAEAVAAARDLAGTLGRRGVTFLECDIADFDEPVPFDLVVGRYVLMHQADPAALIRAAAAHVRPGGVVAFHELVVRGANPTWPSVTLMTQVWDAVMAAFASVLPHPDVANRLVAHFRGAGLGYPTLFCETPVGSGPDSPMYAWFAATLRSVAPQLQRIGGPVPGDIGGLEARLREAALAADSQVMGPHQVCAWVRV